MNKFSFTSYLKDVEKNIDAVKDVRLTKAAKHVAKKMREKASDVWEPGTGPMPGEPPAKRTGELVKGIGYEAELGEMFVGVGKPASHAHLLEFGTEDRYDKKGHYKGRVAPRPFVYPTFEEESETVKKIMSESWL